MTDLLAVAERMEKRAGHMTDTADRMERDGWDAGYARCVANENLLASRILRAVHEARESGALDRAIMHAQNNFPRGRGWREDAALLRTLATEGEDE